MAVQYSVAAIGNVREVSTFSGIPYHFLDAGVRLGFDIRPWKMDLSKLTFDRRMWNLLQILQGQAPGGYQYSESFGQEVLKQIPNDLLQTDIISFNQHFPPAATVRQHGGRVFPYIDATFTQLLNRYGANVGSKIKKETLRRERETFENAEMIFTFQQWAKNSIVADYSIEESKVKVVLPGANITFDKTHVVTAANTIGLGKENPLVLGFVGKEWKRKGLVQLADVRDILEKRGWNVKVKCAGYAPPDFNQRKGVEFAGFIDKAGNTPAFISFLESCHIGCLFSKAEFSSIAVLEFISVGRPVSGFVVDGMGDLFMPSLSIRHVPGSSLESIADGFEKYLTDVSFREKLNQHAIESSVYVRWDRSVSQLMQHLPK